MTRIDPLPAALEGRSAADLSMNEVAELLAWSKAAYDSEIGFVDARIRELFEMFDMERSIVVFLADHGEEFYEHAHLTHGQNLYHETVRVPFFLYLPDEDAPRGRVSSPVGTIDVVPTLRRLLGLPDSDQDQGRDLLGGGPRGPVLAILEPDQVFADADLRSIVSGNYRLIAAAGGQLELYDISRDPLERVDLAATLPEVTTELLDALDRIERSVPRYKRVTRIPPAPNEAMLEHLRGLGYIGK
jgi:arylsulfatase A-like enzyme